LSENGKAPAAHRTGWKDTVRVEGGISEVLVKFDHDAPKEHAYTLSSFPPWLMGCNSRVQ
ncbi:hypothetical protein ONR07_24165, partial [Salmonella enterica subsp. enterica serovar Anatum]|nr:hypothetical protein [Salmonella enterica subsp. enterica serovar Anatum]